MKRIIEGTTYNTDTATRVAFRRPLLQKDQHKDSRLGLKYVTLYQTKKGQFFFHIQNLMHSEGHLESVNNNDAEKFIKDQAEEVYFNPFAVQPNEASETTNFALRIPSSLKSAAETSAKADSISLNSWFIRCAEGCLRRGGAQKQDTKQDDPLVDLCIQYKNTWAKCPVDGDDQAKANWSKEMKQLTALIIATPPASIEAVNELVSLVLFDMENFYTEEEEGYAMLVNASKYLKRIALSSEAASVAKLS